MLQVLKRYKENDLIVTEYTADGQNVYCVVKEAIQIETDPSESLPITQTLADKVNQLQQDNLILMDALASTYEEILMLKAQLGGTVK